MDNLEVDNQPDESVINEPVSDEKIEAAAEEEEYLVEESDDVDIEDQDAIIRDDSSSIQIAPTEEISQLGNEFNPLLFVQLGDRIVIDSKKYGRTIGTVYYRSLEIIRIKPDGVSNRLHDFELEQTDEEELYKEEDGVSAIYIIEKRKFESFVEQQDFRIHQVIDTFDSNGTLHKSYKIMAVDKENDSIKIREEDDLETEYDLQFNFIGIESDEDFIVISIRQFVGEEDSAAPNDAPYEMKYKNDDEEDEEEEKEANTNEQVVEDLGYVTIMRPIVYREAESYEQRIPDYLQKVDALNDFINSLDPVLQKDTKAIRKIRILVETLFNLKQSTVAYNEDGSINGAKNVSASTLAELIQQTNIPLGRPVLDVTKKLYTVEEEDTVESKGDIEDQIYFEDFKMEMEQMIQNQSKVVSSVVSGGQTIIREWLDQQTFLKQYLSPWSSKKEEDPLWKAIADSEFFRTAPPSTQEKSEGHFELLETVPGYLPSNRADTPLVFDKIPFGLERALSTTFRKSVDRKKQVLLSQENAPLDSYLLFPQEVANYMGITRSKQLVIDSGRSQLPPKTMKMILEKIGEPIEMGSTSKDIILLKTSGQTLGNIPLNDYIEGLSIPSLGLGDVFQVLDQYGMDNLELNMPLVETLSRKIELYQKQLVSSLGELRIMIQGESEEKKEPVQNPFLDNPTILETIKSQDILLKTLEEYQRINPSLADSDIGKVIHLMKTYANFFQVTAGKNSLLTAKAVLDANNKQYLDYLNIKNIIRHNQLNAGEKPKKNMCRHVADMVSVRKLFDDADRFHELTKVFKRYQGVREENWIKCNVCKENLLCIHERLQLQAYLNPKEKSTIEKEIILKFSGGQFQGKYICRCCGQAIRDLDFDNSIEFDDDGKPKSGRSILVDDDALLDERIDQLISAPIEESDIKELKLNGEEIKCYNIIREISERVGIHLTKDGFRDIINRLLSFINTLPTKQVYNKHKTTMEYEVFLARHLVTAAAVFLLIEIQSKIPSYVVRYALLGCKSPGFEGYPLDEDKGKRQGLEYIACAISSITRKDYPWNQTLFQNERDDTKRVAGILFYMLRILDSIIGDDIIQANLGEKRRYLTQVMGVVAEEFGEYSKDMIPSTFLPQLKLTSPEESAKNVITPEVAEKMGNRGKKALVQLWIRQAHLMAQQTAAIVRGSPLSETTCCVAPINSPGEFWKKQNELPPIGKRTLSPNQQGKFLITHFIPREVGNDVAEIDKDLYFRIFLKYCFDGPRIGHLHEPGLTNRCIWCGFQFPSHPSILDTDTDGKTALNTQEVKTDGPEFVKLLDTVHTVNDVKPIKIMKLLSVEEIMDDFGSVEPAPLSNWKEIIKETTQRFLRLSNNSNRDDAALASKLRNDVDRGDIALAAGPISDATIEFEKLISAKLKLYTSTLDEISKLPWNNFFEVIQTYFITPFQRQLSKFSKDSLFIPHEHTDSLSDKHLEDIQRFLNTSTRSLEGSRYDIYQEKTELARSKIKYYLQQMSILLPYKNKIRPIVIPGKDTTLVYIQRALLYGPLATLISAFEIPDGTELKSAIKEIGDPSIEIILRNIAFTLNKYNNEKVIYDDSRIKDLIAIHDEKERQHVIKEFDKLTDEERAVEKINKKLGIGKWAVGGTKLIYAYDKDYYDLEREKRLSAGIIDFPGQGDGELSMPSGREHDEYGFPVYHDNDFEREGGYEHNQHGDDDNE